MELAAKKTMLGLTMNAEADKLARAPCARTWARRRRPVQWVPGEGARPQRRQLPGPRPSAASRHSRLRTPWCSKQRSFFRLRSAASSIYAESAESFRMARNKAPGPHPLNLLRARNAYVQSQNTQETTMDMSKLEAMLASARQMSEEAGEKLGRVYGRGFRQVAARFWSA